MINRNALNNTFSNLNGKLRKFSFTLVTFVLFPFTLLAVAIGMVIEQFNPILSSELALVTMILFYAIMLCHSDKGQDKFKLVVEKFPKDPLWMVAVWIITGFGVFGVLWH